MYLLIRKWGDRKGQKPNICRLNTNLGKRKTFAIYFNICFSIFIMLSDFEKKQEKILR